MNNLLDFEGEIRLSAFIVIFLIMALWELKYPYRKLRLSRLKRWPHQLSLIFLNTAVIRLFFPIAAVGTAQFLQQQSWGLMNWLGLSSAVSIFCGFIILDFAIYWQHVVAHQLNWFWQLHRTHHADTDYDLTTGLRFHPLEIALSMLFKMLVITILGIPAIAVILFEIVLSSSAMFNHSNIKIPDNIEFLLRKLIVTPGMHRIHHSIHQFEHDSNYGFFLSIWDHLFRSYTHKAMENDQVMPIGLKIFRHQHHQRLDNILKIPFSNH